MEIPENIHTSTIVQTEGQLGKHVYITAINEKKEALA